MHVPRKAVYPTLVLIETLASLLNLRQGENDTLLTYLEKFKSEKNVVVSLFGNKLLDGHVENTDAYRNIPSGDADAKARLQKEMKDKALE